MKKFTRKWSAVCLAAALLCSACLPASAAGGNFSDVDPNAWYAGAVEYVKEQDLFLGESDGEFHPDSLMTRAMLTQVLARKTANYSGEAWVGESGSTDVDKEIWYAAPVEWTAKSGITDGVGNDRFRTDLAVTREEMAVMLYRYAQRTGTGISSAEGAGNRFADAAQIASWAAAAVDWAVSNGLMNGYPDGTLRPNQGISRAEAACMLYAAGEVLKETEILYPKGAPLPEEIGASGAGRDLWKTDEYLCKEFGELHGFTPGFSTTAPEGISGLPVYREKSFELTEERKDGLQKAAEEFLIAAGRGDLVEAGLVPNEYLWKESDVPVFSCEFSDFTLSVRQEGISLSLGLPGIRDMEKSGVEAMLRENRLLAAACAAAGIDDPVLSSQKDYIVSGDDFRRSITVSQNSSDPEEAVKNRTFSSLSILSEGSESDITVVSFPRPGVSEEIGKYVLLPYHEALAQLRKEQGVQSGDVLGYKIEYDNKITAGYDMPYYKFYFEKDSEIHLDGFSNYCEYGVRAVKE